MRYDRISWDVCEAEVKLVGGDSSIHLRFSPQPLATLRLVAAEALARSLRQRVLGSSTEVQSTVSEIFAQSVRETDLQPDLVPDVRCFW